MTMIKLIYFIKLTVLMTVLSGVSVSAFEPRIKLSGRKDVVLSGESRQVVIDVAQTFLAESETDYIAAIESLENPFGFEAPAPVEASVISETVAEKTAEPVLIFRDAEVLEAAAQDFASKVRGSMTRGDTRFLQLEGGILLKRGTSFPVRLPEAGDKTFTLTVSEISSNGYTLSMGDSSKTLNYENNSSAGAGAVQFSNP